MSLEKGAQEIVENGVCNASSQDVLLVATSMPGIGAFRATTLASETLVNLGTAPRRNAKALLQKCENDT